MKQRYSIWIISVVCCAQTMVLSAQVTDNIVRSKLRQIALGYANDVRAELPELMRNYPDDPGILFLSATLTSDGMKALPQFVRIVREYPQSIWADDAQWRIVQIYALRKDTANARSELQLFRRSYPTSEFLLFAAEIVKSTVGLPPTFTTYRNSVVFAAAAPAIPKVLEPQVPAAKTSLRVGNNAEQSAPELLSHDREERYTLQVGIYNSRENALADVQKLSKARLRSDLVEKNIDGAVRYAVTVGSYSSREAAEKAKPIVQKACSCIPFVIVK
ncbi:MAG: SPOR domain-containing protein [Bacteroidota bacterium]|nr:SPOR domain-containing protein [Candidatus Kapabacteria bacterium]MDW8219050.1 SPOR domain-containing protein [Bacteroidota bacterium]